MKIGIIGAGAIGNYVREKALERGYIIRALLLRPERLGEHKGRAGDTACVSSVADLPDDIDCMVDCAGHKALAAYGPDILRSGKNLVTVSLGALADEGIHADLARAATSGNATLLLASGAIGSLDCLQAARVGAIDSVTYIGRKPPQGWKGSPAETRLNLDELGDTPATHFEGSARVAATEYPKNANVAAAVALAGIGFDETRVELIADPGVTENIHELRASGDFGHFAFEMRGHSLPDNPRSSALAAMSVIARLEQETQPIRF